MKLKLREVGKILGGREILIVGEATLVEAWSLELGGGVASESTALHRSRLATYIADQSQCARMPAVPLAEGS